METIRCKPWGKGQGDHVLVNACDFDPAFHVRADELATAPAAGAAVEPTKTTKGKKATAPAADTTEG